MNRETTHNAERPSFAIQAGNSIKGCVVHNFSIELYWLDVNVRCQPNVCSFK
jgi:hypothetical protein